jgi:hypothetical protein
MTSQTAKAPRKGASTNSHYPSPTLAEGALQKCYRRDLQKDARWQQLSPGARHVAEHLAGHLGRSGEFFGGAAKRAKLVPALSGGRPSDSGYISLPTLRRYERELERSGLFTVWFTNGTRLANGLRTNPIKILRLARSVWALAWARFKYACGGTFSLVKTEAFSKGRVGRLSKRVGRRLPLCGDDGVPLWRRSTAKIPDWADYCSNAKPELELRRARWNIDQRFERRAAGSAPPLTTAPKW